MSLTTPQPIIIIRKKKASHGGHHGGAWKVAYADFVTAMLSLFIVLWLLSSSEQVQKAVGGYFTDPKGHGKDVGNGLRGSGSESLSLHRDDMNKIRDKLAEAIQSSAAIEKIKEHVVFTVTSEGLRVELLEGEVSTFFESANSNPTTFGKDLLQKLAVEIGKLPNKVTMEGHTDARAFAGDGSYTNWELSSDRANAARRWMVGNGLRGDQVTQVRGFADQSPRDAAHPEDATNRRVTLVIQYQMEKAVAETKEPAPVKKPAPSAPGAKPADLPPAKKPAAAAENKEPGAVKKPAPSTPAAKPALQAPGAKPTELPPAKKPAAIAENKESGLVKKPAPLTPAAKPAELPKK